MQIAEFEQMFYEKVRIWAPPVYRCKKALKNFFRAFFY